MASDHQRERSGHKRATHSDTLPDPTTFIAAVRRPLAHPATRDHHLIRFFVHHPRSPPPTTPPSPTTVSDNTYYPFSAYLGCTPCSGVLLGWRGICAGAVGRGPSRFLGAGACEVISSMRPVSAASRVRAEGACGERVRAADTSTFASAMTRIRLVGRARRGQPAVPRARAPWLGLGRGRCVAGRRRSAIVGRRRGSRGRRFRLR